MVSRLGIAKHKLKERVEYLSGTLKQDCARTCIPENTLPMDSLLIIAVDLVFHVK